MKKYSFIIVSFFVVFLLSGCVSKDKEQHLSCKLYSKDVLSGYELNATYDAYAKDEVVTSTKSKEVVTSQEETILDSFEETLTTTYKTLNESYGGYTYKVNRNKTEVISDVTIDYEAMNLTAFVKDQPTVKQYMNNSLRFTLSGIQAMYEELGATCELK